MKSWKKRWKHELDSIVPPLEESIRQLPISSAAENNPNGGNTLARAKKNTLITVFTAIIVLLVGAAIICGIMLSPKPADDGFAFTVEINPSATFITDKDGKVTAIISSNTDADVVLADETALSSVIGQPVEVAMVWYADRAAMLGYLTAEKSAIRISACEKGGELLQNAKTDLEKYFISKGYFSAVVCQTVDAQEFAVRSGLNITESGVYSDLVKDVKTLFNIRESDSADIEKLQSLYKDGVLTSDLVCAVKDFLSGNVERIRQNAEDLTQIGKLYISILRHDDNPASVLKDYWNVEKIYGEKFDGEFGLLMSQMSNALARYEDTYFVRIENSIQLESAISQYLTTSVDSIISLIDNFSKDVMLRYCELLSNIMETAGINNNGIATLFSLPQSIQDFENKLYIALEIEFDSRKAANADIYGNTIAISPDEYTNFLNGVITEFGSLEEFWKQSK